MTSHNLHFQDLHHKSSEFDAAYDIIAADISTEYLETREFLRKRLRVRDVGADTATEKILIQAGYTLHLVAAFIGDTIVGAIYGHLISHITEDNLSVGFVTYITVHPAHRRHGVGTAMILELQRIVNEEALRLTGKPIFGMVYEIEEKGKEGIKATVKRLGALPLDIVYHQPALRPGYEPEQMNLWFQPVPRIPHEMIVAFTMNATIVRGIVQNMLTMEYVGSELKGFDLQSRPYIAFLDSIVNKITISILPEESSLS